MVFQESDEHILDNQDLAHSILLNMPCCVRKYLILSIDPTYQTGTGRPVHSKIANKLIQLGITESPKTAKILKSEVEFVVAELKAKYGTDIL